MHMLIMSLIMGGLCLAGALCGQQPKRDIEKQKGTEHIKVVPPQAPSNEAKNISGQILEGKELASGHVVPEAKSAEIVSPQVLNTPVDQDIKEQGITGTINVTAPVKEPMVKVEQKGSEQESPQKQEPEVAEEMISIDTIDLDQPEGNWLNKRIWWERAKDKYKECRDVYEGIFASRMIFLEKRAEIEKTILNPFYREIGLEQADIRTILTTLIEDIEREREETGFLDEKEREFLDKLILSKKDLEQLMLDIDTIDDIDSHIDKAINTLNGKINEAHRFEQSAWQEFEAIAHELSDKKAYERYYIIDGLHKNLKELKKYIDHEFSSYFDSLIQAAKDKTDRARKEIQDLKDHGIDLKEQHGLLVAEEQINEEEQARIAEQKAAEAAKKAAQAAQSGFFTKMLNAVINFFKALWNVLFGWWLYRI